MVSVLFPYDSYYRFYFCLHTRQSKNYYDSSVTSMNKYLFLMILPCNTSNVIVNTFGGLSLLFSFKKSYIWGSITGLLMFAHKIRINKGWLRFLCILNVMISFMYQ